MTPQLWGTAFLLLKGSGFCASAPSLRLAFCLIACRVFEVAAVSVATSFLIKIAPPARVAPRQVRPALRCVALIGAFRLGAG